MLLDEIKKREEREKREEETKNEKHKTPFQELTGYKRTSDDNFQAVILFILGFIVIPLTIHFIGQLIK